MRGKPNNFLETYPRARITPADAGKTILLPPFVEQLQDHPRGCGENLMTYFPIRCIVGSPPRMRGKLLLHLANNDKHRITPADAGKTHLHRKNVLYNVDHPRGCGENLLRFHLHR